MLLVQVKRGAEEGNVGGKRLRSGVCFRKERRFRSSIKARDRGERWND